MRIFPLQQTIEEFYQEGLTDENLVMEIVKKNCGGKARKASWKEDRYDHIDFWWDSPKKGTIGIDVKGVKKASRKDANKNDNINWIETVGVTGYPGWIYGKSEYIAFRTYKDIIFVRTAVLREYAEKVIEGKELVHKLPQECYIPYQRFGRKDTVFKCTNDDLRELSKNNGFILEYSQN